MKLKYFISTAFILGVSANAQAQKWFNCKACPAGTYSDGIHGCKTCSAGTYSSAGSISCTACQANSTSSAGAKSIDDCICNTGYKKSGNSCVIKTCTVFETFFSSGNGSGCKGETKSFQILFGQTVSASQHISVSAPGPNADCRSPTSCKTTISCSGSFISQIIYSDGTTYSPAGNEVRTNDGTNISVSNSATCK
ncbi:MAG: hypothetical protein K6F04_04020 [bacterium]|nr:hypothetical protein [bacterium]